MAAAPLELTLAQLPDAPGVYQMLAAGGEVLYIGKAISLRNRVRSYFQGSAQHHPRIAAMVARVADIETTVVGNEIEALILEANLIKRYQPPFNVRMRDDKRYPYLKVTNEPFARVHFTRTLAPDGARYFGPFTNARDLRELIDLVRMVFPLRTCREPIDGKRARPCLQYHIKRCLAPCVGYQSREEYDAIVDDVVLFLEGKHEALLARLNAEMEAAAAEMRFEAAASIRDRTIAVRRVTERQRVVWRSRIDMDLIACARAQGQACMEVFVVRGGKLVGQEHVILDGVAAREPQEIYAEFLTQFYSSRAAGDERRTFSAISEGRVARDNAAPAPASARARPYAASVVPKELLLEAMPEDREAIERQLSGIKGQRVRILVPQRGERADYLRLVARNAEQHLKAFLAHQEVQESAQARALDELAQALELPDLPRRIECYDISNVQGTNPVASMVVFVEGRAKKSAYRKFAIQYKDGPNDFEMMREVLRRRLRYLAQREEEDALGVDRTKRERFSARPDLLLIDGGKGQLGVAVEVLDELGLAGIPVAGLAKEHEWLYLPERSEPIVLPPGSPALHLAIRVRDEAHRFAISFHRKKRDKAMIRSALDEVPGLGPVRRKRLLATFGSVAAIRRAELDAVAAVKGMTPTLAAAVRARLDERPPA